MLELDGLSHRYGAELALDDISFGVDAGELVAVLGPSGCGKTTLVQAIAGHIRPTAGRVVLRGEDVTGEPPETRRVSVVFQQPTLYPHMTVRENVAYGLAAQDVGPDRRERLVGEFLALVELHDQHNSYPGELSGGQQRRVELARALAPQPDVLLLDEPLSALDRSLRERLREEIARLQRETDVTTLCITHDQEDAMALADRLVVMNDGSIAGTGPPRALYESPPTPFVASFLGRSNTLSATVVESDPLTVALDDQRLTLPETSTSAPAGARVTCHVRPEDVSLRATEADTPNPSLSVKVVHVADVGRRYDVTVQSSAGDELVVEVAANPPSVGDTVTARVPADRVTVFGADRR